jgi:Sec20
MHVHVCVCVCTRSCSSHCSFAIVERTSNQLRSAMAEHENFSDSVRQSERLLTTRRRRDRTDSILLSAGVAFFFLVVAYIVKTRLFG